MRHGQAAVAIQPSGQVHVHTEIAPHGQGQATSFAQIAADVLGVRPSDVQVLLGDTATAPPGHGAIASRGTPVGGSAIYLALQQAHQRLALIAAHLLSCAPEDVAFVDGRVFNRQDPEQATSFAQVASAASRSGTLPPQLQSDLHFTGDHTLSGNPFSFGTHVAVVEIDRDTADVRVVRYVAVQDCGRTINPMLVEGQVHGGIAQGLGQALLEMVAYDEDGQPLSSTFLDYGIPTAEDFPSLVLDSTETPSPTNPLGVKGTGELATVGSPAALANAVVDALSQAGIRHVDTPLTPNRLWQALRETGP